MTFAFSAAGDSIGLTVDWDGSTTVATTVAFKIDSLFGADTAVSVDIDAGSTTSAEVATKIYDKLVLQALIVSRTVTTRIH